MFKISRKPHRAAADRVVAHCAGHPRRRAVAATEFAVCLPVIVLLLMGSLETTSLIFLKQSLHVAAYEAARAGCRIDANHSEATHKAQQILDSRQVHSPTIEFSAADVALVPRGEPVLVEVSAPTSANSPLSGQWLPNRVLTARVYMLKE